jgi:WXXGXW repeat (2 copies)
MFKKSFLSAALGVLLTMSAASAADVFVRIGPPAPVVETRVVSPGPGYVWTPGYHRWDGNRYVWTAGTWVQPPRPHAHWVAHHWVHRNGGWVMVEGHWR